MRCGKTLAHCFFKQYNDIYGGIPPTLDNTKTEPYLVNLFVDLMFVHIAQLTHKTNLKSILAATVLIFHYTILGIIGNEPPGKYNDPTHHPFHHKIISFLVETQISMETFRKWQDEVISGFNEKVGW